MKFQRGCRLIYGLLAQAFFPAGPDGIRGQGSCLHIELIAMGAEVVGQSVYNKVGHVRVHLLGEQYMRAKPLISKEKSTYFDLQVTDAGRIYS
jgi:hypothetical protein